MDGVVAGTDVDDVDEDVDEDVVGGEVVDPVDDATVVDDVVLVVGDDVDPTDVDDPWSTGREPSAGDAAAEVGGVVRALPSSSPPPQALSNRVAITRVETVRR